jgi:hypothetical protein
MLDFRNDARPEPGAAAATMLLGWDIPLQRIRTALRDFCAMWANRDVDHVTSCGNF